MKEYDQTIEAMAAACDELRRVSGQEYASAELQVTTNTYATNKERHVDTEWKMYCSSTGSVRAETLAQAMELALQKCGPAEMLARAKQLRAEADKLEAKAGEAVAA